MFSDLVSHTTTRYKYIQTDSEWSILPLKMCRIVPDYRFVPATSSHRKVTVIRCIVSGLCRMYTTFRDVYIYQTWERGVSPRERVSATWHAKDKPFLWLLGKFQGLSVCSFFWGVILTISVPKQRIRMRFGSDVGRTYLLRVTARTCS